jgi:hypothetical protein
MNRKLECELLLVILSGNVDKAKTLRFEELTISDWENIFQQAVRHGVTPFLYHRLKEFDSDIQVPDNINKKLRDSYLFTLARNIRLFDELSEVLRLFQKNDIPVIVLKGAYLAKFVYENIALRQMYDIDLLVKEDDFSKVEEKLLKMDYRTLVNNRVEGKNKVSKYPTNFVKHGAFPMDIHLAVARPNRYFTLDVEDIWRSARSVTLGYVDFLALSNENLLLHLCYHASFQHRFCFGLRSLCDISETIRRYSNVIHWDQVQQQAYQWGIVKYIYLTLSLARELLEADVPVEVLEGLKPDGFDPKIIAMIKDQVFRFRDAIAEAPPFSTHLGQLCEDGSLKDKFLLLLKRIFPSPKFIAKEYSLSPRSLRVYFYYPMRWKDLLLRHSRSALRLMLRDEEMLYLAKSEMDRMKLDDWLA